MSYREEIKEVNRKLERLEDFKTKVNNQLETLEKKILELQLKAPKSGESPEKKKTATRKKLTLSKP